MSHAVLSLVNRSRRSILNHGRQLINLSNYREHTKKFNYKPEDNSVLTSRENLPIINIPFYCRGSIKNIKKEMHFEQIMTQKRSKSKKKQQTEGIK